MSYLLPLLALAAAARADHPVTFTNNCPFSLTPMWKANSDGPSMHTGSTISGGSSWSMSLPEIWETGRLYAQDPKRTCLEPDGAACTLVECNFGPGASRFWQCNLSLVSGYNVPTAYAFTGGTDASCSAPAGFACTSQHCPATDAYLPSGACQGCINQCNTDGVGLHITYCPAGSTIPNMGQPASAPPASSAPATTPAPPKSTPIVSISLSAGAGGAQNVQTSKTSSAVSSSSAAAATSPATPTTLSGSGSSAHCSKKARMAKRAQKKKRETVAAHRRAMLARADFS